MTGTEAFKEFNMKWKHLFYVNTFYKTHYQLITQTPSFTEQLRAGSGCRRQACEWGAGIIICFLDKKFIKYS